jgi:putative ABC transport system ATP-binding protein
MIQLANIHKRFTIGELETEILKGISFTVEEGELVSIMGASGSGKSTLMNIIGMLDEPSSGSYLFEDIDVLKADSDTLAQLRNQKIGFVFQSFNLLSRLSSLDNICLPLAYRGISKQQSRPLAMAMLEKVELADKAMHKPGELSGGQRQRVAIARALIGKPSLLLADEPTGALDTDAGRNIMELFLRLNHDDGITVIVISHDPGIAAKCRRRLLIQDGLLVNKLEVKD